MLSLNLPSPIQLLTHPIFDAHQLTVHIKRDDLIDPNISGNKWRKLKYNLQAAQQQNCNALASFGGAYSNHLRAVAAAGAGLGLGYFWLCARRTQRNYKPKFKVLPTSGHDAFLY